MPYREALGMLQRAIREVTTEDVADAIHETFDPIQVIEIQDMLYHRRQLRLQAELKTAQAREPGSEGGAA